jgi:hypothetical protein
VLLGLVDQTPPVQLQEPNGHDNWPITATALVARSANLVEAMLAVQPLHQRLEGTALHRILYEHVTTFAWLAIDPPTRMERWLSSDARQRLSTADDMNKLEGSDPMPPDARQEMERRAKANILPSLVDLAAAVDREWSPRLPELSAPKGRYASFRGMYTGVFREGCAFIHARTYGIESVVSSSGLQVLVGRDEKPFGPVNTFTLTPITPNVATAARAMGSAVPGARRAVRGRRPRLAAAQPSRHRDDHWPPDCGPPCGESPYRRGHLTAETLRQLDEIWPGYGGEAAEAYAW